MRALGLDFGTTNSGLSWLDTDRADASVSLAKFPRVSADGLALDGESSTFRSILYFPQDDESGLRARGKAQPLAGPWAMAASMREGGAGRRIQSIKSHLASRLFTKTQVLGRTYTLEELVASLAQSIREHAEKSLGPLTTSEKTSHLRRIVVGRPVRFMHAETLADDDWAIERLRNGLAMAGFEDVEFALEPIGAAFHYEESLDHDELALIADFGGGTSDFSLIRVGPGVRARERGADRVLGNDGVALAGDVFDGALVQHALAPHFGAGSKYRPASGLGRSVDVLAAEVPPWIFRKLERWHLLSFLKSKETLDFLYGVRRQALEPQKIDALLHLIEADLGFAMYRSVERTKVALSAEERTVMELVDAPIDVHEPVARAAFEAWIQADLASIGACVDRLLDKAGVDARDVDVVFMTGGTSLVPAVRAEFARRFGDGKLRGGDELTSVAAGLARVAAERA